MVGLVMMICLAVVGTYAAHTVSSVWRDETRDRAAALQGKIEAHRHQLWFDDLLRRGIDGQDQKATEELMEYLDTGKRT